MNTSSWRLPALASARSAWALVTLVAIIVTWTESAARGPVNFFDFFGYFTIQSNSLLTVTAAIAGIAGFVRQGPQARWIVVLRALATMSMVIVGVVYATLLAPLGLEGGAPVPWANWVMHVGGPILIAIDWTFSRDREPLPWRTAFLLLLYPIVWVVVVLVRGATDGWVPYPFLNPSQGYGVVAVYVATIAVAFALVSTLVVWWSRRWIWRDAGIAMLQTQQTRSA